MGDRIPVVEVFGPTLQGEGRDIGKPCHFIRFGGCDFKCGWDESKGAFREDGWVCDSLHAVLPEHVRKAEKLTADEIVERVRALPGNPGWVILSGGNPVLHDLHGVVDGLHKKGFKVAVETQGSLWKDWLLKVDLVTVSPKPPSTHMVFHPKLLRGMVDQLYEGGVGCVIKVVIWDEADLDFAEYFAQNYGAPLYLSVCNDWQKPDSSEDLLARLRWIQETIVDRYPSLSRIPILPQLHVLLWGNERGR